MKRTPPSALWMTLLVRGRCGRCSGPRGLPAHLHQLPALEGADGLEVLCHEPGDGGLAGAGVAGEDHVHREAGGLEARRRTALLHLNVIGKTEDVFLHRCKAHEVVQLFPDFFHCAGIGGGQ